MEKETITHVQLFKKFLEIFKTSQFNFFRRTLLALVLTLGIIGLNLLVPLIFKNLVVLFSDLQTLNTACIGWILLGYGISWAMSQLLTLFRTYLIFRVMEDSFRVLSLALLKHLLSLPMSFHANKKTGGISGDISRLQPAFESVFWGAFLTLIPVSIEVLILAGIIGSIHGWLCGIILGGVLAGLGTVQYFGIKKSNKAQERYYKKRSFTSAKVVDTLLNFDAVKIFTNEEGEYEQIDRAYKQQGLAAKKLIKTDTLFQLIQILLIAFAFISITLISGRAVYLGNLPMGSFILVNGYLLQLVLPLNYIGDVISQIRRGLQDIRLTFQMFSTTPENINRGSPISSSEQLQIEFNHVAFHYNQNRPVLEDVSFSILPGEKVGIIGTSGSGKSTLVRLLLRFYDPIHGSILINGSDSRTYSPKELRKAIGLVSQDTFLFNDTLYYNIAYANPRATRAMVEEAIHLAELDSLIDSLPKGYYTEVGERSLKLSGGEKQRVAIARAILKKPSLYIFDEATSALDSVTEQKVQKNLERIAEGKTTITITHRLSSIQNSNQLIVLNQGRIIAKDPRKPLLETEQLLQEYWSKQPSENDLILHV